MESDMQSTHDFCEGGKRDPGKVRSSPVSGPSTGSWGGGSWGGKKGTRLLGEILSQEKGAGFPGHGKQPVLA